MWIPPDWMVWTYIAILALMTVASFAIAQVEGKLDDIRITDFLGMFATIAILYDWLSDGVSRSNLAILLLLAIYTLANADALVRGMRSETFETEEEAQETFIFTAGFVLVLSLPLYYLGMVMMSMG